MHPWPLTGPPGAFLTLLLLPQLAAPTLRHLTKAPLAYAEGQTLYLDFTLL
jgi:hypothetical protein